MSWWWALVALWAGGIGGFFVAALLCAGARADEAREIAQAHARDRQ